MHLTARTLLVALLCLGTCGCKAAVDDFTRQADSLRDATERLAKDSQARSNAREQEILATAAEMQKRASPAPTLARYELRRTPSGWGVYDVFKGDPATWRGADQTNLTRERAELILSRLQAQETPVLPTPPRRR